VGLIQGQVPVRRYGICKYLVPCTSDESDDFDKLIHCWIALPLRRALTLPIIQKSFQMPRPRRNRYRANEAVDYGYVPEPAYDYGSRSHSYGYGSGSTWGLYGNGSSSSYHAFPGQSYVSNYSSYAGYQNPPYDDRGDYSGDYYGTEYAADFSENSNFSSPPRDQRRSYHTNTVTSPIHSSSPSPPPRRSPSPSYLSTSLTPSTVLSSSSPARKLLILDLNGTLLLRSPRPPRHSHVNGKPPPRKVHPRPYLTTFVEYIFHPKNKTWLDTMVWSSAQPHSVADMVDKCFGKKRNELIAIWARDKMGLTQAQYCQCPQPVPIVYTGLIFFKYM
jgi:hypothetical protein